MDWKNWLGYGAYKKLWSLIGGRQWTYIWRDVYHLAPYAIQALWFFIGVAIFIWYGWLGVGVFWAIYTFGYIEGHFHFGTPWIKGQGG